MKKLRLSQTQIIALGFFLIISAGTALLMLPFATRGGGSAGFSTALFTATSASCVTGLVLRDTYTFWAPFGQVVIIVLIQLGGLGFMTVAALFSLALRRRIGIRRRELMSESINSSHIGGIVKLTKKILVGTVCLEGLGTVLLALRFCPLFGFWEGLGNAAFHSVSAFCNAGFDLMGRYGEFSSFVSFADDWLVNLTVMFLIIAGGIGFLVWDDLWTHRLRWKRYQLHTKIVLTVTGILLALGTVGFLLMEGPAADGRASTKLLTALFSSVTARTAGFNTTDIAVYSPGTKLLTIMLMFVGGSPGSTAGGIKTTTIAVLFLYAFSYTRKTESFGMFGRRLESGSLRKSSAVFFTNLVLALTGALLICGSQRLDLVDTLFETFSAIGTVGMTTGVTRELTLFSQYVVIFLMYCGRVGSLSFASAIGTRKTPPPVQDPVEKITIG